MDYKIKSFTLIELIIAMLLTSIISFISFFVYQTLKKQFEKNYEESRNITEKIALVNDLNQQFTDADYILIKDHELLFYNKHLSYIFTNSLIVRKGNEIQTDTFEFNIQDLQIEINNYQLVSTVSFSIIDSMESYPVDLIKNYTPEQLVNYANNLSHGFDQTNYK